MSLFSKVELCKTDELLDKSRAAREERATERQREVAAITTQALIRRYLVRCRICRLIRQEVDLLLCIPAQSDVSYIPVFKSAAEVYHVIQRFFLIYKQSEDAQRLEYLCRYIVASMSTDTTKHMYVSLLMSKELVLPWIAQLKELLWKCCKYFTVLKLECQHDMKMLSVLLPLLVTFTSSNGWKILNSKAGESLKPGVNQLINNIMGHLTTKGFYSTLQTLLLNGLCKAKPLFKATTLSAVVMISLRPLIASEYSANIMTLFTVHISSVPALVQHVSVLSPDCLNLLITNRIFSKTVSLLCDAQSTKIVFNTLEGNYALCLLANLIQLGGTELEGLVENSSNFMRVVTRLLQCCQQYVQNKRSNLTHWHPVLGWFAQKTDQSFTDWVDHHFIRVQRIVLQPTHIQSIKFEVRQFARVAVLVMRTQEAACLHEAMPLVVRQLSELWSLKMIKLLFEPVFLFTASLDGSVSEQTSSSSAASPSKNLLKKAVEKATTSRHNAFQLKVDSHVVTSTCDACGVYLMAIETLTQLRLSILAGLCCQDILLSRLWTLMGCLGNQHGLRFFLEALTGRTSTTTPALLNLLRLSCDASHHILIILDEVEMYERQQPFSLPLLVSVSSFLNHFVFHVIWDGLIDVQSATGNEVFVSSHTLLLTLYDRDCRRSFTLPNHWLIKDMKLSVFLAELDHHKKTAMFLLQKVPHIIPHNEVSGFKEHRMRVVVFRKIVARDKEMLGLLESSRISPQSTLITVHRNRIIEDGYRQLATLCPAALKGVIRVKFINEQGLDEAGIDQDGVFKEFLEETIKRVFDPSLNLFKVTDDHKLYPSPVSFLQDNHLALFEFVGRMLGKAVYEGIVVDVPFASFFLSQLLGRNQHSAIYSCMDDLPSFDPELYKSLTYIKHCDGDISDLELTFSFDEDTMGKIVTHELVTGGKAIPVMNENKIRYVHLMAHFKMRVQIREQSNAFIRGFKSIISADWLDMFSMQELQKLMSGDASDIDIEDLRRHTQYYGGFHNGHRVIGWLWDILKNDFSPHERSQFLKFVTSCSKAPLLGFANLEPPFSIRCVEVSDEQDTGDTVGSVLKGFFNIRRKEPVGRLPTSSTCFNLLKLPNYQKKSTLREKLRYSISSNTGFELS